MTTLDPTLVAYVEQHILPRYNHFDKAHDVRHARKVIDESLVLAADHEVDVAMVYVIAAYHDLGLAIDRKTHHLHSGAILMADEHLSAWFDEAQLHTMAQAVEDHRASSKSDPRTIYGRIVAEADRDIVPTTIIRRTIQFGLKHYPDQTARDFHFARALEHITVKYGEGGYLKLHLASAKNQQGLAELRCLLADKVEFERTFDHIFAEESDS